MVLGRKWFAEMNSNVGGSKRRVGRKRFRAKMDPLSVATPTYSSPGVRDSFGAIMDFTRSMYMVRTEQLQRFVRTHFQSNALHRSIEK